MSVPDASKMEMKDFLYNYLFTNGPQMSAAQRLPRFAKNYLARLRGNAIRILVACDDLQI